MFRIGGAVKAKKKRKLPRSLTHPKFVYVNLNNVWTTKETKHGSMLKGGLILSWGAKGIGYGQITFRQKAVRGSLKNIVVECESECMGREFVAQALEHLAKTVKIIE